MEETFSLGKRGSYVINLCNKSHDIDLIFRYDYENCDSEPCNKMMNDLESLMNEPSFIGSTHEFEGKSFIVALADNFSYTDPIDGSISTKQVKNNTEYMKQGVLTIWCHFSRVCGLFFKMAHGLSFGLVEQEAPAPLFAFTLIATNQTLINIFLTHRYIFIVARKPCFAFYKQCFLRIEFRSC